MKGFYKMNRNIGKICRGCVVVISVMFVFLTGCYVYEEPAREFQMTGQHEKSFQKTVTKTVSCRYLLFLPRDYGREEKPWPLIMFLHGAGERGSDLEKVKVHGPPKIVEKQKDFPFIVVSPQCPEEKWWPGQIDILINLLDDIESRYNVDKDRVYLTGLSMGGYGTWSLACEYPERFAAIAPICGGGQRLLAGKLKDMPIWAFHGAKDKTVPPERSQEMVDAVNSRGGNAKLTIYPDAAHNSWTATYDNKELYDWFLQHRISDRAK